MLIHQVGSPLPTSRLPRTLLQAAFEAQIDRGPIVVLSSASLCTMKSTESHDIGVAAKEPDAQYVVLADEGWTAEDNPRTRREMALQRDLRGRQTECDAVLHCDRVFAGVNVLEHV